MTPRRWFAGLALTLFGVFAFMMGVILFHVFRNRDIPAPDFSDLSPSFRTLPQDENAYPFWVEAGSLLVDEGYDLRNAFWENEPYDVEEIDAWIAKNEAALSKVREGLHRPGLVSNIPYRFDSSWVDVTTWIDLARMMHTGAEHARREGEMDRAVSLNCDLNQFGHRVCATGGTLIVQLIGNAQVSLGLKQTRDLARDPRVTSEHLQQLMASIGSDEEIIQGAQESLCGDFASIQDLFSRQADDPDSVPDFTKQTCGDYITTFTRIPFLWEYMFHPNRSLVITAREFRLAPKSIATPWVEHNREEVPEIEEWLKEGTFSQFARPNGVGMAYLNYLLFKPDSVPDRVTQTRVANRITRVILACRMFEIEKGEWPQSLEHLVPAYFEEVPTDLFSGEPLRYDPDRGIVWSVGKDREDQNGSVLDAQGDYTRDQRRAEDQVYSTKVAFEVLIGPEP